GAAGARTSPDLSLVGKRDGAPVRRKARLDGAEGPGQPRRRLLGRPVAARPDQHENEDEHGPECSDQSAVHRQVLHKGSRSLALGVKGILRPTAFPPTAVEGLPAARLVPPGGASAGGPGAGLGVGCTSDFWYQRLSPFGRAG